jgi:hypothetical protein
MQNKINLIKKKRIITNFGTSTTLITKDKINKIIHLILKTHSLHLLDGQAYI